MMGGRCGAAIGVVVCACTCACDRAHAHVHAYARVHAPVRVRVHVGARFTCVLHVSVELGGSRPRAWYEDTILF